MKERKEGRKGGRERGKEERREGGLNQFSKNIPGNRRPKKYFVRRNLEMEMDR